MIRLNICAVEEGREVRSRPWRRGISKANVAIQFQVVLPEKRLELILLNRPYFSILYYSKRSVGKS